MARPQTTVLQALAKRLHDDPDGPYLDFEGIEYSTRRMDVESNRLANALVAKGVAKGDRVASLLENGPEQVVTFFAVLKLGAIAVPINTAYKGEFLRHQLADSGSRAVIVQHDFSERVASVVDDLPDLETVITVGRDWDSTLENASAAPLQDVHVEPSDLACFIYTAGTTGPSKGCMLPHNYIVSLADQIARAWQRDADDVVLTPLPLFHFNAISVCVVGTLLVGGRSSIARRFSVSRFWPEVQRTGATMLSMLGSLAILIANAPDHPEQEGHRLRLCAAAPMPPDIDRIWRERFGCATFSGGYGLTEASLISMLPAGIENKRGAAGKPNDVEFEVRLVGDDDQDVPVGDVGEIVCRAKGPNLMFAGYWGLPEATQEAMRNGWFHSGDLGRLDDDGFLYFVDRKKDSLRRRGENISSFEMERTFYGHPAIKDVAVHSVASDVGEDDVKLTVVLQPDAALREEELCRWAVDRVPYFAVPRYIEFREDLPRNPVGRVLKYQLRAEGVTPTTWDREASGLTFERR